MTWNGVLAGFRRIDGASNTKELRYSSQPLRLSSRMELLRENKGSESVLCCIVPEV